MEKWGHWGSHQAAPKFLRLFDKTSLCEFRPTNSVPRLHIHLSSVCFNSSSLSQQSTITTCNAEMANSMSSLWCCPKCLDSPHTVQLLFRMSYLSRFHIFRRSIIISRVTTGTNNIINNIWCAAVYPFPDEVPYSIISGDN